MSKIPEGTTHWVKRDVQHPFRKMLPAEPPKAWSESSGWYELSPWTNEAYTCITQHPDYCAHDHASNGGCPECGEVEWKKGDLPPVGTVCEMQHSSWAEYLWEKRKVLFVGKRYVVTSEPGDDVEKVSYTAEVSFRPIRTDEQIKAEERTAAIEEMWGIYWKPEPQTAKEALGLLWDAGYRKQEAAK